MATFCLIHGHWHRGSSWDAVAEGLQAQGHRAVAPDLPIEDPATTWEDRAEVALQALPDDGPVVVVAHSASSGYGGIVASRLDDPLLVYLCPRLGEFDAPAGAPDPFRPGFPFPPRDDAGVSAWDQEAAIAAMYPRFDRRTALELVADLRPTAPPAGPYPMTAPPPVAITLIYTPEDEFFEPEFERFMARELLGIEPIEMPGGHFPMVEDPAGLTDLLVRLAREPPQSVRSA